LPQTFAVSLAVRRGDQALLARLSRLLTMRRREIDAILAEYHVPRVDR
jgi:mxaJ protein